MKNKILHEWHWQHEWLCATIFFLCAIFCLEEGIYMRIPKGCFVFLSILIVFQNKTGITYWGLLASYFISTPKYFILLFVAIDLTRSISDDLKTNRKNH